MEDGFQTSLSILHVLNTANAATRLANASKRAITLTVYISNVEADNQMKMALAGKGGSGKTTLASLIARNLSRRGRSVWAIDADSNPNLGLSLGLSREHLNQHSGLPRSILREQTDSTGQRRFVLDRPPVEVARSYGIGTADGVTLLVMGAVDHGGAG